MWPASELSRLLSARVTGHADAEARRSVSGETEGEAGLKKVAFEKTPKMSTYLLAMAP
ncbi:hypothetical protein T484DRAFT_1840765 [Baffinella frigidus]|nr:hypothetical protein T484DRAFT_1840765 [Cryptophyta sp. CCMP2293]